jgi:uncharacterized RDD family membrane protein YckC
MKQRRPAEGVGTPPRAGLARRLAALVYDGLLLLALLFGATFAVLPLTGGEAVPVAEPAFRAYLLGVVYAYFALPWVRSGQTLGLKAWHLRVEGRDGGRLTWSRALARLLAALPSVGLLGLGLLWVLVDRDGLAWHDRLSGTRVVRVEG